MSAKDAANTLWALARIGCPTIKTPLEPYLDNEITDCLLQTLYQTSDDFIILTCSNVLWSFAMLDFNYADIAFILPHILRKIYVEMDSDTHLGKCKKEHIGQLKDFLDYYKDNFSERMKQDILRLMLCVNRRVREIKAPRSSISHRDVESVLKRCTTSTFKSEVPIAGGFADICFTAEKVVFEFNGPVHYEKDSRTLNAHSRFRQRMMEKNGYRVFHINYLDWQNASDKEEFIRNLLLVTGLPIQAVEPLPSLRIFLPAEGPSVVFEASSSVFFVTIPRAIPDSLKRSRDEVDDRDIRDEESTRKYPRY